jgi:hypothetical protein
MCECPGEADTSRGLTYTNGGDLVQMDKSYNPPDEPVAATVEVPLSRGRVTRIGYVTRIDAADRVFTDGHKWHAVATPWTVYARTIINGRYILLHRLLCPWWDEVDHEDGDGLNNVRSNLRDGAGRGKNGANTGMRTNNTSGYKGVLWNRRTCKWFAQIKVNGKQIYLGTYAEPEAAADAYDRAAVRHFGEYAKTNAMMRRDGQTRPRVRPVPRSPATECLRGHPFDEENTYIMPKTGYRGCRICRRDQKRKGGKPCPPGCTCGRHRRKEAA